MNLYLKRLLDERDSLTASATSITETAARAERDVTDTERASIDSMATRCAAIDEQLGTYQAQADSARAYATMRSAIIDRDDTDDDHSRSGTGSSGGRQLDTRDGGGDLDTRGLDDLEFGAAFQVRAADVLAAYPGRGRSDVIEIGSAISSLDERAIITTADLGTAPDKTRRVPTPPAWRSALLGLVTTVPVGTGVVEWLRTGPNPGSEAKEVAEGALKPEMDFTITLNEDKLKTFAHWKGITRQALDDLSSLRSILENRLRVGLQRKIATEVADTLLADADIPALPAESLLAGIRIGMASFDDESGYSPTGVALNPLDWAQIDLDALSQIIGQGPNVSTGVWGLRFAASSRIPRGTAYVGDFGQAVTYFDRRVTNVFLTDSHADFFLRNQLVILAETRGLCVVEEPFALMKVTAEADDGGSGQLAASQEGNTVTATAGA